MIVINICSDPLEYIRPSHIVSLYQRLAILAKGRRCFLAGLAYGTAQWLDKPLGPKDGVHCRRRSRILFHRPLLAP